MLRVQGVNLPNMKISLDRAMNSEEISKPESIAIHRTAGLEDRERDLVGHTASGDDQVRTLRKLSRTRLTQGV